MPPRTVIGAVAVAVLTALAGSPIGGSAPAASSRAAVLYMSPGGSDASPCTRSAPCRTFDRAYHRARAGQMVQLAGGAYPAGQEMTFDRTKSSSRDVVFRAAPGAVATVARTSGDYASLDVRGAAHITFRNIRISGDLGITPSDDGAHLASDISVLGGKLTSIHLRSGRYVTFRGVEIGNFSYASGASSSWFTSDGPSAPPSTHIVVDRVLWHNIRTEGSPTHPECLIVDAVNGITIRNSRFVACPVMALFFSGDNGRVAQNVLVENNFLSCGGGPWNEDCGATINFRPDYTFRNVTVRFNSISGILYMQSGSYSNVRIYGNVISGSADCHGTFEFNILSRGRCGSSDRVAAPGWVSESRADLRLKPGARAVNFVPRALCAHWQCPRADIRGHRRSSRPDAGAYELR